MEVEEEGEEEEEEAEVVGERGAAVLTRAR